MYKHIGAMLYYPRYPLY